MASRLPRRWEARFEGLSRRDREGCDYQAYLLDPLVPWELTIPADVAADVADAEAAIRDLNQSGTAHVSLEGLARFLLRAESVGSSRIEGLTPAARRLAEAEASLAITGRADDAVAVEVIGNIAAMESAVTLAAQATRFGLDELLTVHRTLMANSPTPDMGGAIRSVQNWIGGSSYNPCRASFVPPPPEHLADLLADLLDYLNDDRHSPVAQAALVHAQFETLHPFADGNGRTGRALVHVVLRRRGLAPRFVPPISLVLATWATDYVEGLTAFRHLSAADSPERSAATSAWLRVFASATARACAEARRYSHLVAGVAEGWRADLGRVRARSSVDLLLQVLPGAPIVTVESAQALIGRSKARTAEAINTLTAAGVLRQRNIGRQRSRVFEATGILDLFTGLERALATETGDTTTEPLVRPAPARP